MKKQSEFGQGFIYNLVLFAKHFERLRDYTKTYEKMREKSPDLFSENTALEMWFNGAGDHFFEMQIPKNIDAKLGKKLKSLQKRALKNRLSWGELTKKDFVKFFEDLENICMEIDKQIFKVDVKKAHWN